MAIITQGIAGPISGKVGGFVGYRWRQRACLRALPAHVNYPNTELQQRQRDWFVGMVRFASRAKEALQLGLRHPSLEAGMTEGNYFILKNKQHFKREGDSYEVDYAQLRLSEGDAADVYFHEARFEADEVVSVGFEKNAGLRFSAGDDHVYLFAYAPALDAGMLSAPAERRSKNLSIRLPEAWAGAVIHLYGFVVDHSGRASKSTYIGVGRVNHYEDRTRYMPTDSVWQEFVDLAAASNDRPQDTSHSDPTAAALHEGAKMPATASKDGSQLPPG